MYAIQKKPVAKSALWYIRNHWQLYALVTLPVVLTIVFSYVPMTGILIAFKNYKLKLGIFGSEWVGFKYFEQFFASPSSRRIIVNTIIISLYSIVAGFPFPILLAVLFNECKSKSLKKTAQMLTYAPYFISTVVLVGIVRSALDPQMGVINQIVKSFGAQPIAFMGIKEWFQHIYVWSGVWQGTGYGAVIYLAALSGVPVELYEAATIDGATKMRRIWHIDLAYLIPTATIVMILNFGSIMSVGFEKVYLLQTSANLALSEIISTYVYKVGLINMNMSLSTAINLFNSGVNIVLILLVNTLAKKIGETSLF